MFKVIVFLVSILFLIACNTVTEIPQAVNNDLQEVTNELEESADESQGFDEVDHILEENTYIPFDSSAPIRRIDDHEIIQVRELEITPIRGRLLFTSDSDDYYFWDYQYVVKRYENNEWVTLSYPEGHAVTLFGMTWQGAIEGNYHWNMFESFEEGLTPGTYRLIKGFNKGIASAENGGLGELIEIIIEFDVDLHSLAVGRLSPCQLQVNHNVQNVNEQDRETENLIQILRDTNSHYFHRDEPEIIRIDNNDHIEIVPIAIGPRFGHFLFINRSNIEYSQNTGYRLEMYENNEWVELLFPEYVHLEESARRLHDGIPITYNWNLLEVNQNRLLPGRYRLHTHVWSCYPELEDIIFEFTIK